MLQSLRLQNFRSYKDDSFEFDKGVNIIVGPNACGKTNLLEAVYFLSRGKGFRTRDKQTIYFGENWSRLDGFFDSGERVIRLDYRTGDFKKSFEIDNKSYSRLPESKAVPIVLFEPNDLQFMVLGPQKRRDYLDNILEQTSQGYKKAKAGYERALAQRNSLLKSRAASSDQFFIWDIKLSELGGTLTSARMELIDKINKTLSGHYSSIAGKKSKLQIEHLSSINTNNYTSNFLKKLQKDINEDKQRGFTGCGPHRDDIKLILNNQNAETSASRGETRTILLSLKVFESNLLQNKFNALPLLLFDDVFSELDSSRRRFLVDFLKDRQTLITTTDADAVIEYFSDHHNLIPIQKLTSD